MPTVTRDESQKPHEPFFKKDEVSDFVARIQRSEALSLNTHLESGRKINPETAARVGRMSVKTGLPKEVVHTNLDELEQREQVQAFPADFWKTSPLTARYIRDNSPFYDGMKDEDILSMGNTERLLARDPRQWRKSQSQIDKEVLKRTEKIRQREEAERTFFDDSSIFGDTEGARITRFVQEQSDDFRTQLEFEEDFISGDEPVGGIEQIKKRFIENSSFMVPFLSSIGDATRLTDLYRAATAVEAGNENEDHIDILVRYGRLAEAAERRGQSITGITAGIATELIPFAVELGTTAGTFTAAKNITSQSLKAGSEKLLRGSIQKVLKRKLPLIGSIGGFASKNTSRIVGTLAQSIAAGPGRIASTTIQSLTPIGTTSFGDDRSVSFEVVPKSGKPFSIALKEGVYRQFVEVFSEKLGGPVSRAFSKSKIGSALSSRFVKEGGKAEKVLKLQESLKKVGIHGVFAEMGEEEVGKFMIDIGGLEPYRAPTGKELAAQALAFGAPVVLRSGGMFLDRNLQSQSETVLEGIAEEVEKDAKIQENSPIEYKRMLHESVKGTNKETVEMPIEQFNQLFKGKTDEEGRALVPREVIAQVLGDTKAYDEAMETGGDISIPMEEFATTLNQSDFAEDIRKITKFDENDVTSLESEKILEEMEANVAEQEAGFEDQERRAQFARSAQRVADDIRDNLIGKTVQVPVKDRKTGEQVFKKSAINAVSANNYATLYERVFRTLGLRSGEDPFELYQRFSLGITQPTVAAERKAREEEEVSEEELLARIEEAKATREKAIADLKIPDLELDPVEVSRIVSEAERAERRAKRQLKELGKREDETFFFQGEDPEASIVKGNISFGTDHKVDINLFETADFTTFLHESGHFFLEVFKNLAVSKTASEDMKQDFQRIKEWFKEKPLKQSLKEIEAVVKKTEQMAKKDPSLEELAKNQRDAFNMAKKGGRKFMDEFIDTFGENVNRVHFATLMTPYHEQFARGFELYLSDPANSPVKELNGLFHTFRTWIVGVYRNLRRLNVKLSNDIKDVMNGFLATKEEMQNSQAEQGSVPIFPEPLEVGMTVELAESYQNIINDALQKAEEAISTQVMEVETRKKTAEYRNRKKEIQPEVETEANQMRVYKALANMQTNKNPDGTPLDSGVFQVKLDKAELLEVIGVERLSKLPTPLIYTTQDGLGLDVAASMLGYDSVQEMIFEIELSEKKADFIKNETERRLHEEFGDPLSPDVLPDEVNKALHNEKRSQLLKKELDFLVSENFSTFKGLVRRVARPIPTVKEVRRRAQQIIDAKQVDRIKPIVYKRGEAKASRTAIEAMLKGDFQAAIESKKLELLNHELFRAATDANSSVEKNLKAFRRMDQSDKKLSKQRDMGLVKTARGVLAEYGIGRGTAKTLQESLQFLRSYGKGDQADVLTDLVSRVTAVSKPFGESSFKDFMNMAETVNALWKLSKSAETVRKEEKKISIEEAVKPMIELADERKSFKDAPDVSTIFGKFSKQRIKRGIIGGKSLLTRIESWIRSMDKGSPTGPFRTFIWNPIIEGTTKSTKKAAGFIGEYKGFLDEIKDTISVEKIEANELDFTFANKAQLLGAMLHIGNNSNKSKLLRGYQWGELDEDGNLDSSRWDRFIARMEEEGIITEKDYEFLQKTWDLFEQTKVDAQKAHIDLYGFGFDEIIADPVVTSFGTFRGGYAPAVIDYMNIDNINESVEDRGLTPEQLEDKNQSFMFPTTAKGFINTRVENYARPLQMSLELVPMHINKVMRFSFIEAPVRDVHDLLRNKEFRASLNNFDPSIIPDMLNPWLERTASQRISKASEGQFGGPLMDSVWRAIRKRSSQSIMFLSAVNALQQFTGIAVAATKVKPRFLRGAFVEYMKNPKTFAKDISEIDDFMSTRNVTNVIEQTTEIEKIVINPTGLTKVRDFADRHALFLQLATQNFVDNIVWHAAYNEAIQNLGLNEKQAILHAGSMVRETQGGFTAESISAVEVGTPFKRMFVTFYGYFNMLANTLGTEFSIVYRTTTGLDRSAKLFYIYMMGVAIPAVTAEAISVALRGSFDEDDDEEYLDDFIGIFFGSQARTALATIPGSGILAPIINRFDDKWFNDRISVSPAISQLESAGKSFFSVPSAVFGEGKASTAMRDTSALFDLLFGIPTKQASKTAGFFTDLSSGDQDADNVIDFTKGVISGRSGAK